MQHQQPPQHPQMVNWDDAADNYNDFVMCELEDTAVYLDLIGIEPEDTVLDVCCGPGRITMLAAERAKHVTGIDLSVNMLEHARANVEARGLTNVSFQHIDWNLVLPGQNVPVHDVVIASRNAAMFDVEKLSALARKTVMVQIFADAPSIPMLQSALFMGCGQDDTPGPFGGRPGPGGPGGPADGPRRGVYFKLFERIYDAGYKPNARALPERFRKTFATKEDAVAWICLLKPERAAGNEDLIAANAEPFLTQLDNGSWEFCIATTAAIFWWDVSKNPLLDPR